MAFSLLSTFIVSHNLCPIIGSSPVRRPVPPGWLPGNSSAPAHRPSPWTPSGPSSRRRRYGRSPTGPPAWCRPRWASHRGRPFVDPLAKVPDQQIAAHLQVGDGALEVLLPPLPKPARCFRAKENHSSCPAKQSMIRFWRMGPARPPSGCQSHSRLAASWKSGEPCFGDETGLLPKELPVGHPAAAGHEATPLPGVLLHVAGPPVEVGGILLHRETVYLIFEQGQETDLVDPVDQLLPALDAGRVVPLQPRMIHSPFSMATIPPLLCSSMAL